MEALICAGVRVTVAVHQLRTITNQVSLMSCSHKRLAIGRRVYVCVEPNN